MDLLLQLLLLGVCHASSTDDAYMTKDMTPTPGPENPDTVYQPGTPGGVWTDAEVNSTRKRVLQLIHPDWAVKYDMGIASTKLGRNRNGGSGECTENVLLRLMFHDCIRYTDGTGGCDGCLNWKGMHNEIPSPNNDAHKYKFEPTNKTNNQGLDGIAEKLEVIYTTIDWPLQAQTLDISLHQSGKSRADLWQLAGLVALEQALERANRACDLDFHTRQQSTLLESRTKCEIKLTKPLKFLTGRKDCVSEEPEGPGYVTTNTEIQPTLFGDANHVIDFGRDVFGMDAMHWTALQAVHGAVHAANIGLKYTWFGNGYISNQYFKMIANKPTYRQKKGGDLSFTAGNAAVPIGITAVGDSSGNPVEQTGWRASCMYLWNTTEGGPCVLRPIPVTANDAPNPDKIAARCTEQIDSNNECVFSSNSDCTAVTCEGEPLGDTPVMVEQGAKLAGVGSEITGPWYDGVDDAAKRHNQGWNNQFALPYEVGLFWNFTVGGVGQRAIGCPGLDEEFGSITSPKWPYRNNNSPIFASPAMKCEKNTYKPDGGKAMHEIVDELASNNEVFAEAFLEAWQMMTLNGYSAEDLVDGPESGWMGHYSLTQQGVPITPDFETYITENAPVTFTDDKVDPWICGHRGHATTSCGIRFSTYFKVASQPGAKGSSFFPTPSGDL